MLVLRVLFLSFTSFVETSNPSLYFVSEKYLLFTLRQCLDLLKVFVMKPSAVLRGFQQLKDRKQSHNKVFSSPAEMDEKDVENHDCSAGLDKLVHIAVKNCVR